MTQTLSQDWKKELTDQKATYSFEEGKAEMKNILGGKGAGSTASSSELLEESSESPSV